MQNIIQSFSSWKRKGSRRQGPSGGLEELYADIGTRTLYHHIYVAARVE